MPSNQHKKLAQGKWFALTLAQQLGNVGSDFDRALGWKQKNQLTLFTNAVSRTLELLDLTLADRRLTPPRRKEIARLREEVCNELFSRDDRASAQRLQKYFLAMASLAQKTSSTTPDW